MGRLLGLLLIYLAGMATVAGGQDYRGEAVLTLERADPIEFSRLRFLTFAFGHEGPMDTPLATAPISGREYFVEADVFGIESVSTIRFELIDATGRSLQTLSMWKASDAAGDGEFYGFVKVPSQPFRAVASGMGAGGTTFRSVDSTLFQPLANGPPEQAIVPPGISASQSAQLQAMVADYRRQLQVRANQAAGEHPGGVISLARPAVSRIAYEPLTSSSGTPIGIRLRYSIRFSSQQTIAAIPHVFPVYQPNSWRGVVTMKPLGGTITPAPLMVGVQSLRDVLVYEGDATYQANTTYAFTVDMIPDYVIQGTQTGRFCLYEQKFSNRAVWDALIASSAATPYSVSIRDTNTFANIPAFYPQRTLYDSFRAGGALDCGPAPTVRF